VCIVNFVLAVESTRGQMSEVTISMLHYMIRVEFTNVNRRLADMETKVDKLTARCDRIPTVSNDVTACRRELVEVHEAMENLAAAGSRRELDLLAASVEDVDQHDRQWPELPVCSDDDWELLTALLVTEETMPPHKRLFSNYVSRRIVALAKNAKAPIKAAIRCLINDRWAAERMSMLGWRIIDGRKTCGFKAFHEVRPFVIATINEAS